MKRPLILFFVSLLLAMSAFFPNSPLGVEVFYIGIISAFTAFLLLVLSALKGDAPKAGKTVILDGSNVMHWRNNEPDLRSVRLVAAAARKKGLKPIVWFDANVGYKASGKYMSPAQIARQIAVPQRDIHLSPTGMPADPLLLKNADRLKARVISNDKFRDWVETHPYVRSYGFLVPGELTGRSVQLSLV